MTGVPLRSVPTGDHHPTAGATDADVDIAADALDADLEPVLGATRVGTTAVVLAASLLDFLR